MKFLVVFAVACASVAYARPGGYTLNGGVYKFDPERELDYMEHAKKAGERKSRRIKINLGRYWM